VKDLLALTGHCTQLHREEQQPTAMAPWKRHNSGKSSALVQFTDKWIIYIYINIIYIHAPIEISTDWQIGK
jgi:hypothetical protein